MKKIKTFCIFQELGWKPTEKEVKLMESMKKEKVDFMVVSRYGFKFDQTYVNEISYTQIAKFMGPTWVLSAPDGPHVGPMNLAIRVDMHW